MGRGPERRRHRGTDDASGGRVPSAETQDEEAEGGVGYRAVELPYVGGNVSMVLVVPSRDRSLADLVGVVDAAWLGSRFAEFDRRGPDRAQVEMPRFTFGNDFVLDDRLKALGMTTAFDPDRTNFRGMTDPPSAARGLHLDRVFHDTQVAVDEEGTVAVAVSASIGEQISSPPSITLDRPFLFCIRDSETIAVLFLGRFLDPNQG